jgi:hypothetical protein
LYLWFEAFEDQDIRKQLNDLKGFEPQIQKADALEQRMKAGRQRAPVAHL